MYLMFVLVFIRKNNTLKLLHLCLSNIFQLTVINTGLLKLLSNISEGVPNYLSLLPHFVEGILNSAKGRRGKPGFDAETDILHMLGKRIQSENENLENEIGIQNVLFGAWLNKNDSYAKSVILSYQENNFTVRQMRGLFNCLMSTECAFGANVFANVTRVNQCIHGSETLLEKNNCGLLFYLRKYSENNSTNMTYNIDKFLCPNISYACFMISNPSLEITKAWIEVLTDYAFNHLMKLVLKKLSNVTDFEIFHTKTQSDLALGFFTNFSHTVLHTPGILAHYASTTEALNDPQNPRITLLTCFAEGELMSNLKWKGNY